MSAHIAKTLMPHDRTTVKMIFPTKDLANKLLRLVRVIAQRSAAVAVVAATIATAEGATPQTITFPAIGNKFILDSPLTLSATASSGLPVTFTTNTPSVCTIAGNTATLLAPGTCNLYANQVGNVAYNTTSVLQAITVSKTNQTITFPTIGNKFILDSPLTLSATASSSLPVTFTTNTPSVCTIAGNTATLLAPGTCNLYANQVGNVAYNTTSVLQAITVSKTNQTINFPTIGNKFILDSPLTLSATASSSLPVTFTTNTPSVCTIAGNTATLLAPGTCNLYANQVGNVAYNPASVLQAITVSKTNQTITFPTIAAQSMATPTMGLAASASSGLAVTFTSTTPAVCTVSGVTATWVTAGSCTIAANQAGSVAYNAASQVTQSFTVSKANQTITFGSIATQSVGLPLSLTATSSSSLVVTYTSATTTICTVSGTTVTPIAIGTCTINANQAGNAVYNAAAQVAQSFTVTKGNQTVSFTAIGTQPINLSPALVASATSGLVVAFSSATPTICTVSGNTAALLTPGTCTINANQAGNVNFNAAPQASQSFAVTAGSQTITAFAPPSPITYQPNGTFPLSAAGGASGNPVTFASTTPTICTVSGTTASIVTAGTCTLKANQAGNSNYNAAAEVTATVTITQGTQSISINYPSGGLTVGSVVVITARGGGSSNLVTFASTSPTICTIGTSSAGANGTSLASLSILANGSCLLTANQAGNAQYLAATATTFALSIGASAQIYYIHPDHLGTPRAITNSVGNGKVWEWKNDDPFGNNPPDENPSGVAGTFKYNLRFPGQYFDQETGTMYNYFRDYEPITGRYVQSDPIGLLGGLSTYAYVKSSPLTLIDPWGLLDLLVFDGRRLTGYDGTDIEFSVPAVSGPSGKGRLPPGTYKGDNLRRRTNKAMVCEDGNGWSLDLDPKFKTDRDLLRIHPDGNKPGTEGCIGPDCRYQQQVYDALRDYFNDKKNKQIPVIVVYPK